MRAYKSLKAYKFFEEGYVQKIQSLKHVRDGKDLYIVKADVMASMAQRVYRTFVCSMDDGTVCGGSCTCVAGKEEACSHIAALLLAVDDYIAKGFKDLPDDETVTDKICGWNKPAKRKVEPKTIHNIRIVKQDHGKTLKEKSTFDKQNFDPRQPGDRTLTAESTEKLVSVLITANPTCGFMKYNKPLDIILPEQAQTQDTNKLTNKIFPPSIQEIREACDKYKETLSLTDDERKQLELESRTQSKSLNLSNVGLNHNCLVTIIVGTTSGVMCLITAIGLVCFIYHRRIKKPTSIGRGASNIDTNTQRNSVFHVPYWNNPTYCQTGRIYYVMESITNTDSTSPSHEEANGSHYETMSPMSPTRSSRSLVETNTNRNHSLPAYEEVNRSTYVPMSLMPPAGSNLYAMETTINNYLTSPRNGHKQTSL